MSYLLAETPCNNSFNHISPYLIKHSIKLVPEFLHLLENRSLEFNIHTCLSIASFATPLTTFCPWIATFPATTFPTLIFCATCPTFPTTTFPGLTFPAFSATPPPFSATWFSVFLGTFPTFSEFPPTFFAFPPTFSS